MQLHIDEVESPIGVLLVVAGPRGLCALDFADCRDRMQRLLAARYAHTGLTPRADPDGHSSRVRAYFDGALDALDGAPVDPGGTPFQQQVWSALRRVRRGSTASYAQLAREIGRPASARAVGAANARNPVALAIPCHRVIGADGSLTGYAGGVERKRWLLAHEGVDI